MSASCSATGSAVRPSLDQLPNALLGRDVASLARPAGPVLSSPPHSDRPRRRLAWAVPLHGRGRPLWGRAGRASA
eukprot:1984324-Alexandrium_andersonii.AAC.1